MICSQFQDKALSLLGFGAMRLPCAQDGTIDEAQLAQMVDMAMRGGVNYFDTAYPYHGGKSEIALGKALRRYPRESYCLADKYPGHQISESYDPAAVFEDQLKKCGAEYFDFYLLHNVYENSIKIYLDPRWGIVDYFREQKRLGRIRHLGFSCHGGTALLREFLDVCGADMEFCQIQLNYLDWTLQDARAKVELLNERGVPIWVMEPVRGGRLCRLAPEDEARLHALRPDENIAAWGFRFLQEIPGVRMILSGMSAPAQMEDNLKTFAQRRPLSAAETQTLFDIAEGMKDSVPCTACRYCTAGCPKGLNIPALLSAYNEMRFSPALGVAMRIEALPEEKRPAACIGCGKCARVCPQSIAIPQELKHFAARLQELPSWAEICRQRNEAQKK